MGSGRRLAALKNSCVRYSGCNMSPGCRLYYITDRTAFPGDEPSRRQRLLAKIEEAARADIDYIQLREKDLPSRDLESLAQRAVCIIREAKTLTRLLINSRTDIALATGADGVHLRSDDISPASARSIAQSATRNPQHESRSFLVAVSCHSTEEISRAESAGADFAVFAPVFEKFAANPAGLIGLRDTCKIKFPVFALGGVSLSNAQACLDAGAAGIAGIRLFQENDVADVVRRFRT